LSTFQVFQKSKNVFFCNFFGGRQSKTATLDDKLGMRGFDLAESLRVAARGKERPIFEGQNLKKKKKKDKKG
jgi:hypothetical protein